MVNDFRNVIREDILTFIDEINNEISKSLKGDITGNDIIECIDTLEKMSPDSNITKKIKTMGQRMKKLLKEKKDPNFDNIGDSMKIKDYKQLIKDMKDNQNKKVEEAKDILNEMSNIKTLLLWGPFGLHKLYQLTGTATEKQCYEFAIKCLKIVQEYFKWDKNAYVPRKIQEYVKTLSTLQSNNSAPDDT